MRLRRVLCASILPWLCSGGLARAAVVHPEALALPGMDARIIPRTGQPDWYVLPGGDSNIRVSVALLGVPDACSSEPPVVVSLYNPEGHWIRTVAGADIKSPRYPGRYLLQVAITDPTCDGVLYGIGKTTFTQGSGGHSSAVTRCNALAAAARDDATRSMLAAADAKRYKGGARKRLLKISKMYAQQASGEGRAAKTCH